MPKIDDYRKAYESTPIPPELSQMVDRLLRETHIEKPKEKTIMEKLNGKHKAFYRTVASAAAVAIMVGAFGVGVNTNEAFAAAMSDVPVLGSLVKVFVGEQINEDNDIYRVEMTLPAVEGLSDPAVAERINQEIHDKMTAVVEEAKIRMAEDKEAWLATGGTEAEYMQREVVVDYEVKALTDTTLSFMVYKTETSASAYFDQYYYNIDLATSQDITLESLLGPDYIAVANAQIAAEITKRSENPDNMYFTGEEGGFATIAADQSFYVNEAGHPVIVFNKYDIAPGYMGIQEFEVIPPAASGQ